MTHLSFRFAKNPDQTSTTILAGRRISKILTKPPRIFPRSAGPSHTRHFGTDPPWHGGIWVVRFETPEPGAPDSSYGRPKSHLLAADTAPRMGRSTLASDSPKTLTNLHGFCETEDPKNPDQLPRIFPRSAGPSHARHFGTDPPWRDLKL